MLAIALAGYRQRMRLGQMIEGVQYRPEAESMAVTAEHASDWGTSGTRIRNVRRR
jgi:hypothetical protein